jgi:6-pyruvoyl-tetrahydropterin synthase
MLRRVITDGAACMFSVTVCDHIMIAHSLRGAAFGPGQRLHGATLAVEAEFRAAKLDAQQALIDIGLARAELRHVLDAFDYSNLDDNPELAGINTTIEFMAMHLHARLAAACRAGRMGEHGRALDGIKVLIRESPVAWAAFEGPPG